MVDWHSEEQVGLAIDAALMSAEIKGGDFHVMFIDVGRSIMSHSRASCEDFDFSQLDPVGEPSEFERRFVFERQDIKQGVLLSLLEAKPDYTPLGIQEDLKRGYSFYSCFIKVPCCDCVCQVIGMLDPEAVIKIREAK